MTGHNKRSVVACDDKMAGLNRRVNYYRDLLLKLERRVDVLEEWESDDGFPITMFIKFPKPKE